MITQKIIVRTDSLKLDKIISRYGEDSMRQVVFIIVRPDPDSEELIPITIPEDAVGSFRILKPSGNFVIVPMSKSLLTTGETAFDVVLPASANTAKGSGYYDIRITSDTDKYYFTAQGDFLIDDNIISDEVLEDVSEVNGLVFPDDFLTVEDHVAYIDDDTISIDSTWSSNKINEEIEAHAGGDVSKTVSGNPITFTDGADAPLVKCDVAITGSQDLHGYDKPWVGGAGKNKLPLVLSDIKALNTSGTWSGDDYTISGVTFAVNTDGDGNITSIKAKGTPTYNAILHFAYGTFSTSQNMILNGCPSGGGESTYQIDVTGGSTYYQDSGSGVSIPSGLENKTVRIRISGDNGSLGNGVTFYPMIRLATVTDSTFAPYSNICPITAYTEGEIEVSDGDGNVTTHTTTYPSAIYRGSEDVVNGEVTSEWPVIELPSTGWMQEGDYAGVYTNYSFGVSNSYPQLICSAATRGTSYSNILNNDGRIGISASRIIWHESSFASANDLMTYLSNNVVQIAYELATPTTTTVTPTNLPIKSLSGYTHIESSTGDMEVEYITQRFQPLIDSIKQL